MLQSLYYSTYYAFLCGDLKKTQLYYGLLRNEFREVGKKDSLRADQYRQLAKIKTALNTGALPVSSWVTDQSLYTGHSPEKTTYRQTALVPTIHNKGLKTLKEILRDSVELSNIEHPCPPYGNVDMVYQSSDTVYPLEVKKDRGGHDLIGQIMKYDLFFRLRLHYNLYHKVQAVTVCGSYDPFALSQLKKMGVKTLYYAWDANSFRLSEI